MTKWRKISTATKDGRQILTYGPCNLSGRDEKYWYQTSFWSDSYKVFTGWPSFSQPTHWQELPKPPKG